MKRLAVITTHPIQYNAPLFKLLNEREKIKIKVFYTWGEGVLKNKYDPGFGRTIEWDIPLLDGYEHSFMKNTSADPGSHHYNGIVNPELIKEIKKWNANAVLVFGWNFKSHLHLIRHFNRKIQVIFRGDSTLLDELPGLSFKKLSRRLFLRWVYSHVDNALYVGNANKQYYIRHGLDSGQLIFAPHAIDNKRFGSHELDNLKTSIGIPENAITFLFAGKLEEKKDPLLLLDAFALIELSVAYLLIVGNGELETRLKHSITKLPLETRTRIKFLPFQNQQKMPSIYHSVDIVVVPSKGPGETWGLSVNEAMAAGKPVLVSNKCGCVSDLVKEGVTGYSFQSGNKNDLLQKMNLMIKDPKKIKIMGIHARSEIQSWSFQNAAIAIENVVIQHR